jgi:hypothetical protein
MNHTHPHAHHNENHHRVHHAQHDAAYWEHRSAIMLGGLSSSFRGYVVHVLHALKVKGWQPIVYSGKRTKEQQKALIKKGTGGSVSWHVSGTHTNHFVNGIGYTVTGEAADIVDKRYFWQGPAEDLNFAFWRDLGLAAKANGLEWGGDWKGGEHPRDVAHVQIKYMNISQNLRGMIA